VHVTWICNRLDNVRTAWSLGSRDQAVIILQFLAENHRLRPLLQESRAALAGEEGHDGMQTRIDAAERSARKFGLEVLSDPAMAPTALASATAALEEAPVSTRSGRAFVPASRAAEPGPADPVDVESLTEELEDDGVAADMHKAARRALKGKVADGAVEVKLGADGDVKVKVDPKTLLGADDATSKKSKKKKKN
jgi:hypothetical protein